MLSPTPSGDRAATLPSAATVACPVCGDATTLAYERLYDDRYGYPGLYDVRRCGTCGHMHLATRFSASELSNLYTRYYPRASYRIDQHRTPPEPRGIRAWLRGDKSAAMYWVPKGVRVLDIGCGFCESLAYHKARGCDAYGVEADANARKVADEFGYELHIGLFDPGRYQPEHFDVVTLDQVIEHVADPSEFLAGVARVLKPGGTVVISTPNADGWGRRTFGRRWLHWHIPYHLQHFTRDSMGRLAASAGLEVASARSLIRSAWFDLQLTHLLAIPDCGAPHPFWTGKAIGKAGWLGGLLAVLRRCRVHQVASRTLDLLGIGDNHLFTLRKPSRD